jgi:FAD/FMN-containing dehydrogenase
MEPNLKVEFKSRYTWRNATGNVEVTPLQFFFPENENEIAAIIKDAEKRGLRVRAVGSGHSFSEVAVNKDYLISMKKLDKVSRTTDENLRDSWKKRHLVNISAGVILKELNRKLDEIGLALPNMGAVDFQTVSGALLTGTHGTGINKPAFPDLVQSIKMVGTGGELIQVEPANGMTDPLKHGKKSDMRLIQNDDIFQSAVLSFGGMGIVYEVTMEVKPTFWMHEKREIIKWSELRKKLISGEFMQFVENTDFVAFRANPYEVKGDHSCAVVQQHIVAESEKPRGWAATQRNILSSALGNIEYLIESTIRRMNLRPQGAPNTIEQAIRSTKDIAFFGKSHQVLYQSGLAVIRHGISAEFAFEAKADIIVLVLESVFKAAKRNAEIGKLYQTSHVPVRFVDASKALLSSAYGKKTVYIDIPLLHTTIGDYELLERYQDMMIKLGGVPHWGKMNNKLYENIEFIRQKYPRWQTWADVRNDLDPKGTFLNDFIIKMGLS